MPNWTERAERGRQAGLEAFRRIQKARPDLAMSLDLEPEHVDLTLDIPAQAGLSFPLHLNLQNIDELYLCAGGFVLSWFPCTDASRLEAYVDSVIHVLSGTYRILEYRRGNRVVRADLQAPGDGGWRRIGRYEGFNLLPWPPITHSVLHNSPKVDLGKGEDTTP
jgi:hypothetical protein